MVPAGEVGFSLPANSFAFRVTTFRSFVSVQEAALKYLVAVLRYNLLVRSSSV